MGRPMKVMEMIRWRGMQVAKNEDRVSKVRTLRASSASDAWVRDVYNHVVTFSPSKFIRDPEI